MALTAGGLPYPIGTDAVVQGDDAIKALAEASETKWGPKRKHYVDAAISTDVNGLLDVPVPTTATIYGCIVYERNTDPNPNGSVIHIRCYQIDQANHRLRCRAYILNPFGVVSSGAVSLSAIVWTD